MKSIDPVTKKVIWQGKASSKKDVDKAIKDAETAFLKWSNTSIEKRKSYLLKFKKILEKKKSFFAELISMETAKPLWESIAEINSMIAKVDISFKAYELRCPKLTTKMKNGISYTYHKPLGPLAVIGPFNFPAHLPNGHIIPALLAGNTVIFKPSEETPLVGQEFFKLLQAAGLPPSVVTLVQGGPSVGQYLARHPKICGLLFTGSYQTGKKLSILFGHHPEKLLALEMGGNNPLLIGTVKDLDKAVEITIQSAYLTAGQRCTCARRIIVITGKKTDLFIDKLVVRIKTIKVGHYREVPEPFMGPVINNKTANFLLSSQNKLIKQGGKSIVEMKKLKQGLPLLTPGLIDVTNIKKREDNELFGPLLQLIRVKNFEEALREVGNTKYGLSASIITDKKKQWDDFYKTAKFGIVNCNSPTNGALGQNPFGGIGKSGNYRPSALYAADYCSYPVATMKGKST